MKKPKGDYAIQTVSNALRVLDAFRDADDFGVTELAKRLDLHKNNVFRLLATLEQDGYIEQSSEGDRYRLGVRSLELGQAFLRGRPMLGRARPYVRELADHARESAHFSVRREFEVVCVDSHVPEQRIGVPSQVGQRFPLHCTAAGKVLIGCSSDDVREAFDRDLVAEHGLTALTEASITDPHKFFEHVRSAAVRGFALEIEEHEVGLCAAAAPVFGASGEVVGALSIAGPAFRVGEAELLGKVVPAVVAAAEALSSDLGCARNL